jgi:hypothetical protein
MPVVSHNETVRTEFFDEAARPVQHLDGRDVAFHGAAECARQRDVDGLVRGGRQLRDVAERAQRLRACHAQVRKIVAFGRRHHEVQFVRAGFERAFGAAHVRYERAVDDAGAARNLAQHDLGVTQRRDRLRRYKRRDLDLRHSRLRKRID